jgi:hypothetical protein
MEMTASPRPRPDLRWEATTQLPVSPNGSENVLAADASNKGVRYGMLVCTIMSQSWLWTQVCNGDTPAFWNLLAPTLYPNTRMFSMFNVADVHVTYPATNPIM